MPLKEQDAYREYMREYMLRRYRERRARAIRMLGGKCSCGSVEDLQFDHINVETKSFSISKLWSVSEQRFLDELRKCQLLCGPCHAEKTRSNRDIARGRAREAKRRAGESNP